MFFVGVTTGQSSIMRIFPEWARELGLEARIVGIDVGLDEEPEVYREVVGRILKEPGARGALVTSHKTNVYEHAATMFKQLDPFAHLCREVSCIAVRDSGLHGWAKDPITARRSLEHMFNGAGAGLIGRDVLCLGAGGAGLAISVALLSMSPQPRRLMLVDRDPRRLEVARAALEQLTSNQTVAYHQASDPQVVDGLVASLRDRSLIINATGMGKDLPGSPLTPAVEFPAHSFVWDLNYRGELEFLAIARSEQETSDLKVFDGWEYFLHGWTEVLAEVFQLELTPERFARMATLAEAPPTASC